MSFLLHFLDIHNNKYAKITTSRHKLIVNDDGYITTLFFFIDNLDTALHLIRFKRKTKTCDCEIASAFLHNYNRVGYCLKKNYLKVSRKEKLAEPTPI